MRKPLDVSFHKMRLNCYPDSRQASAAIYFHGLPDYWEMKFLLDFLRPGDRFIDVGANIGLYTLLAAGAVGEAGVVEAFEPGQVPVKRLRENCAINRLVQVRVHEEAVGESGGTLDFSDGSEDCTGRVSPAAQAEGTRCVPLVRLDEALGDAPYAAAKFDIEGFEPFALRGMSRLLEAGNPPVFLLEAAGYSKCYGVETHVLMREISGWNYSPMVYDPDRRGLAPAPDHWKIGLTNVLCVNDQAKGFVDKRLKPET